jgi:hypothetical protein
MIRPVSAKGSFLSIAPAGAISRDKRTYVISLTDKGRGLETAALQAAIDAGAPRVPASDVCMRVLDLALVNLEDDGTSIEAVAEVDAMIEQSIYCRQSSLHRAKLFAPRTQQNRFENLNCQNSSSDDEGPDRNRGTASRKPYLRA